MIPNTLAQYRKLSENFSPALGLGIDAGGTQTRWAVADTSGRVLADGKVAGMSALQLSTKTGQLTLRNLFAELTDAAKQSAHPFGVIRQVQAGITGFDNKTHELRNMLASILDMPEQTIQISNDIEVAFLDVFQPGAGYLVYAGTGSIAAYIDEDRQFHRAGGRGYILDDAGGGFWIARKAFQHIWRKEDEQPGSWQESAMAREIFIQIGDHDWNKSREFVYQSSRGDIGKIALAVAAAANSDSVAFTILEQAGHELARLGLALCNRFGNKPIALAGRVQDLHPIIATTMAANIPASSPLQISTSLAHHGAAKIAAQHVRLNEK